MTSARNLARLADEAFERRGDYETLRFEGRWHRSAELFERNCRLAGGLAVEWARQRIGGFKYPREVHILEAMPLTAVGKLDRKALRALVQVPAT